MNEVHPTFECPICTTAAVDGEVYFVGFTPTNITIGNDSVGEVDFRGVRFVDPGLDHVEDFDYEDMVVTKFDDPTILKVSEELKAQIITELDRQESTWTDVNMWFFDGTERQCF